MQFSNKKKAVAGALIAVGGLALVGAGTGASFTDTVTANSTFKTGSADLDITDAPNYGDQRRRQHRDPQAADVDFNTPRVAEFLRHHQGEQQRRHQGAADRGRQDDRARHPWADAPALDEHSNR